jgi:hypothetical protein
MKNSWNHLHPFQNGPLHVQQFSKKFPEENIWNQLNNWKNSSLMTRCTGSRFNIRMKLVGQCFLRVLAYPSITKMTTTIYRKSCFHKIFSKAWYLCNQSALKHHFMNSARGLNEDLRKPFINCQILSMVGGFLRLPLPLKLIATI